MKQEKLKTYIDKEQELLRLRKKLIKLHTAVYGYYPENVFQMTSQELQGHIRICLNAYRYPNEECNDDIDWSVPKPITDVDIRRCKTHKAWRKQDRENSPARKLLKAVHLK